MVTVAAAPQAMVTAMRRIRRYSIIPTRRPPPTLRRQKRMTHGHVNAELLRARFKCAVSAVTQRAPDPTALKSYRLID
jgi:hypothetical protein